MKKNKNKVTLTGLFNKIKEIYKLEGNGSTEYGSNFKINGQFDNLTEEFLGLLGLITENVGYNTKVENVSLDLWKDRIWNIIENAGLLPNIAWKDELEEEEIKDNWENIDSEFDINEISDEEIYRSLI